MGFRVAFRIIHKRRFLYMGSHAAGIAMSANRRSRRNSFATSEAIGEFKSYRHGVAFGLGSSWTALDPALDPDMVVMTLGARLARRILLMTVRAL